jgi:hypothetical protein
MAQSGDPGVGESVQTTPIGPNENSGQENSGQTEQAKRVPEAKPPSFPSLPIGSAVPNSCQPFWKPEHRMPRADELFNQRFNVTNQAYRATEKVVGSGALKF